MRFFQDLTVSLRIFRRRPVAGLIACLSIAVGLSVLSGTMAVVHPVIVAPLMGQEGRPLAVVWCFSGSRYGGVGDAEFLFWRENNRSFEDLAARWALLPGVSFGGATETTWTARVTSDYFGLLGHRFAKGFPFEEGIDLEKNAPAAVLSHATWSNRLGASDDVMGRPIQVQQVPYMVSGIVTETPALDSDIALWTSARLDPNRARGSFVAIGRLRSGSRLPQARAEFQRMHEEFRQQHAGNSCDVVVEPLRDAVLDGHFYDRPPLRPRLVTLLFLAIVLFLTGAVNAGSILRIRAAERQREFGIRLAIGGRMRHLYGALAADVLLFSAVAAAISLPVTYWQHPFIAAGLSGLSGGRLDFHVGAFLGWGATLVLVALALVALVPLLALRRSVVSRAVTPSSSTSAARTGMRPISRGAIGLQAGLAFLLSACAIFAAVGAWRLNSADLGFEPSDLLLMEVRMPIRGYIEQVPPQPGVGRSFRILPNMARFFEDMQAGLKELPGGSAAGMMRLDPAHAWVFFRFPGQSPLSEADMKDYNDPAMQSAALRAVGPGFFDALRIPILEGRSLTGADVRSGRQVAVISASMARRYWGRASPIGERIRVVHRQVKDMSNLPLQEIVGVAADAQFNREETNRSRAIYIPYAQLPTELSAVSIPRLEMAFVLRHPGDPSQLADYARNALAGLDPDATLRRITPVEAALDEPYRLTIYFAELLSVLALAGVVLAAVGTHGVGALLVSLRLWEIGIRKALGAKRRDVWRLLLSSNVLASALGVALAVLPALLLFDSLTKYLPGLNVDGIPVLIAAAGTVLAVVLATLISSLSRADRVDPATLLRAE